MAIPDGHILEIAVSGMAGPSTIMNVMHYHVDSGHPTATGEDVADAWWQAVKGWWRGVANTNFSTVFRDVLCKDITDLGGAYGTYGVPLAEQGGTRTPGASGENLPYFTAIGVRLNVPSRATRPGQKRLVGINEADQSGGLLTPAAIAAAQAWGDQAVQTMTLGAPASLVVLTPVVVHKGAGGVAASWQNMSSATVRDQVTTQNTRKPWRGV